MAEKRIIDIPLRESFDETCNLPVEVLPAEDPDITGRVTGEHVATFANLRPFVGALRNVGLAASVDAGALTLSLKQSDGSNDPDDATNHAKVEAVFRSTSLDSGARVRVAFDAPLSLVIPSGATLGYANAADAKVYVYLYHTGSTQGFAVSSALKSPETLQTLVTITDAADDDGLYSDEFDGDAAIVCIGFIQVSAITTAGTWTAPDILFAGELAAGEGGGEGGPATHVTSPYPPDNNAGDLLLAYEIGTGLITSAGIDPENVVSTSVTDGDVANGELVLFDGTTARVLKGSGVLASSLAAFARQIILSSGGSTEINAAITTLNTAGGGTVLIDGLLDLDGDIVMKSNVELRGAGPGCGLRNNTANAYTIDFIGTTPTSYGLSALTADADIITCDTVGEAADFEVGDWFMLTDEGSTPYRNQAVKIKVAGDTDTGQVGIYDSIGRMPEESNAWSTSSIARKMDFSLAGLSSLELLTTSTGTLSIVVQWAHNVNFNRVKFSEVRALVSECAEVNFSECLFFSEGDTTLDSWVDVGDYVDGVHISTCYFQGAQKGIQTSTGKAIRNLHIWDSVFTGLYLVFTMTGTGATSALRFFSFEDCTIKDMKNPTSGFGYGLSTNNYVREFLIQGNFISSNTVSGGTALNLGWVTDARGAAYGVISGNTIYGGASTLQGVRFVQVTGNKFYGVSSNRTWKNVNFSGNNLSSGMSVSSFGDTDSVDCAITNNLIAGALTLTNGNSKAYLRFNISGNYFSSTVTLGNAAGGFNSLRFIGNHCAGNVTLGFAEALFSDAIIKGNQIVGNLTFTEPDQDGCIIVGNQITGTRTTLTGTGNIQAGNTGQQSYAGDWIAWTPVSTWVANATHTGNYRIVGGVMEGLFKIALTGTPTTANLVIDFPSGYTLDTDKMAADQFRVVGEITSFDLAPVSYVGRVVIDSATAIRLTCPGASGGFTRDFSVSNAAPFTFANGDWIAGQFRIPVVAV